MSSEQARLRPLHKNANGPQSDTYARDQRSDNKPSSQKHEAKHGWGLDPTAMLGVKLSCAAYSPSDIMKAYPALATSRFLKARTPKVFNDTELFVGRLAGDDNVPENLRGQAYIAFRGTEPLTIYDWIQDVWLFKERASWWDAPDDVLVHQGFLFCFDSIREQLAQALKDEFAEPPKRILICGHSLGGALATVAAVWLHVGTNAPWHGQHVPVELVTAGSPKPGNPPMCKAVAETPGIRYTRIIHNLDVVPGIPFSAWGYDHIHENVVFMEKVFLFRQLQYKVHQGGRPASLKKYILPMCAVGIAILIVPLLMLFLVQTAWRFFMALVKDKQSKLSAIRSAAIILTCLLVLNAGVLGPMLYYGLHTHLPPTSVILLVLLAVFPPLMDHFEWKYHTAVSIIAQGGVVPDGMHIAWWRRLVGLYLQTLV